MNRKFQLLLVTGITMILFASCMKDHHRRTENKSVILNVTLNAGETYQLDLNQYGDADDLAAIGQQATSYLTSAISRNVNGHFIYSYARTGSPKTGGNGTDQVVLKITEPDGRCRHHDETTITIQFTIL